VEISAGSNTKDFDRGDKRRRVVTYAVFVFTENRELSRSHRDNPYCQGRKAPVAQKSLVVFALVLVAATVRAEPAGEDVVKFYQVFKKVPGELDASGLILGEKLRAAVALGNSDNIAQLKIGLMDVLLTVHRVKAETKSLKAISSTAGQELARAADAYLQQQEKTILESGPEIVRVAADVSATPDEKKTRLQAIIDRNRQGAAAVATPLTRALLAFAREHDLVGEPTVEFGDFIPPDKSCKVAMPDLTENRTSEINGIKNTYYLAEHKHGVFMLSYADIAPVEESGTARQKRLVDARIGVIKKLDLKIIKESAIVLAGKYPGMELEGTLPDKSLARMRLFIANGRLYQMWVVGAPTWALSAEATRFLTSLELLQS
jgi:hypothetical protein